jgi:CheY-like chemotaxis protein
LAKANILVVEDESIVALDLKHRLQNLGYAVVAIAASGAEAIEEVEETQPDLVLMDIRLKGDMDGIEAAREIQIRFGTPVVYLSALTDKDTLKRAEATRPYGYVIKPFDEPELHNTIEKALKQY